MKCILIYNLQFSLGSFVSSVLMYWTPTITWHKNVISCNTHLLLGKWSFLCGRVRKYLEYTVFTWMQDQIFPLNLMLKYQVPNWTWPNWVALHHTTWSQTKACITNSSYADYRENRAWLKLTNIIKALNFLTHTRENRSGPRVVTWKLLLKNWKLTIRLKNKTWMNSQIETHKKNSELDWSDHRHNTKIRNICNYNS